ncbi:MAG TPA: hypothetical protein VG757_04885 [Devosia sp.]|nr:hypothetical protein [Devosia sp.]
MSVIQFPHAAPPVGPVGHFIRLGESGYQKLASLHAAGRLPATRVVADASRLRHQKELLEAFRTAGAEIVLDTKVAELAAQEKFAGFAHAAPWATIVEGQPLGPEIFSPGAHGDIYGQIARFAVEHKIDVVLAPTHFVNDPQFDGWLNIDRRGCIALREALDREGGRNIAIDYPLIASHVSLNDDAQRSHYLERLSDLPYDNLWVRASGFGHDAAPLTTRRFITSMASLHNLGKPIIADYLGGNVAIAALAFGAVSGIAHGIGERERFDARSWHKPPPEKKPEAKGGRAVRIHVAGLDRAVTIPELEVMASARGGRGLVCCNDRSCCAHGMQDTLGDPRQHAAYQSLASVRDIAAVPDLKREQHFLSGRMADLDRQARLIKELKFPVEEARARKVNADDLTRRLTTHSKQLEKMRLSLEDLHESRAEGTPRARAVQPRAGNSGSTIRTEKK